MEVIAADGREENEQVKGILPVMKPQQLIGLPYHQQRAQRNIDRCEENEIEDAFEHAVIRNSSQRYISVFFSRHVYHFIFQHFKSFY